MLATTFPDRSVIITRSIPVRACRVVTAAGSTAPARSTSSLRTTGLDARFSARVRTRRPSSRANPSRVISTDTAETAISTAMIKISWTATSW